MRLGHRPALDGVRGLAIAGVVGWHAFGEPPQGALGVDLFFVLSGFLITTLLLEEHAASGAIRLRDFYRRRALRLLPALFALLALVTPVVLATDTNRHRTVATVLAALTYSSNIVGLLAGGDIAPALQHLWSLAQEEQFYVLWPPLLIFFLRRRPGALVPVLVALIVAVPVERLIYAAAFSGAHLGRMYLGPDMHGDPILVGCLCGALFVRGSAARLLDTPLRRDLCGFACLAVIVAFAFAFHGGNSANVYATPLLTIFALAAGAFVLCAAGGNSLLARSLSCRPARFGGRISYSLYLWHLPILLAFGTLGTFTWRTWLAVPAGLAAATASHYLVERPFLRLKHRRAAPLAVPAAAGLSAAPGFSRPSV
jgi:peptidoglycan/LPS O-acetylase OafA/YrhL